MNNPDTPYDLIVIGGGSGGVRTARTAQALGAKVALCEKGLLGGTCVNLGCIPKKFMVYASAFPHQSAVARNYGWNAQCQTFNWELFKTKRDNEIKRLRGVYDTLLSKVDVYRSAATINPPANGMHSIAAGEHTLQTTRVVIATGGTANQPPGDLHRAIITSDQAFDISHKPDRMVIVGGGYIAVEFAGIFNGLGVPTTLLYRGEKVLRGFDDDVRDVLGNSIKAAGVDLRLSTSITAVTPETDRTVTVTLSDGTSITTDCLFYAIGRKPNTIGLGLDQAGVATNPNGTIPVDETFETNVKGIYALGDVVGNLTLTPVATGEATILTRALYGKNPSPQSIDYSLVPSAVFSQPEVATCGLTETKANEKYPAIDVYTTTFTPMLTSLNHVPDSDEEPSTEETESLRESERIFMKLVVDRTTDKVLGCHMVGHGAADIVQGLAVALQAGVTKKQVDSTIGIHPTSAEEFVTMREKTR